MKKASGALTKKTFKLNQSEFWSGFIKGLATGLLTLLLWYLTYSFLMRAEVFTLALLFVGEWLLPVCIFHVTMKRTARKWACWSATTAYSFSACCTWHFS